MLYSTEICYFYFLGSLFMYEEGIAYYHQHHGIIVLPKPEFAALHLYDGVSRTIIPSIFSNNLRCKIFVLLLYVAGFTERCVDASCDVQGSDV